MTGLHKGQNASKNCVTKNLELFQDIPNLEELPFFVRYALWSKSSMITTISRFFSTDLMFLKIPICPLTWHLMTSFLSLLFCDWSFLVPIIWPNELSRLYGNPSLWPRFSHFQKFWIYKWFSMLWRQKEIYYSPVTIHPVLFMTLFTPKFCLFKGGCPLCFKQVLVKFSSGLLS